MDSSFYLFINYCQLFFLLLWQNANKMRSDCAITGHNLSNKNKGTMYKNTERRAKLGRS